MLRNQKLCHFFSYNAIEDEAHIALECPLYNSAREITIFGNGRFFHDFETILGCGFQIKDKANTKIYSM